MGFFGQFDKFDPLTGCPPDHPFSSLPTIASRARVLLNGRTRDQIISAARPLIGLSTSIFELRRSPQLPGSNNTENGY